MLDELFQDVHIDVRQFFEVEAGFAGFVFAQLGQQVFVGGKTRHDIENQVLFSRGKPRQEPFTRFAAGVGELVTAEAHDVLAVHGCGFAGQFGHDPGDLLCILAFLRVLDRVQEGLDRGIVLFGFRFCHEFSPFGHLRPGHARF